MNQEQWERIVREVLEFNRIVTIPEERNTEAYLLKHYDLVEEEQGEMWDAEYDLHRSLRDYNEPHQIQEMSVKFLDGVCDTIVTAIQVVDATTPSKLEWEYVRRFFDDLEVTDCWDKYGDKLLAGVIDPILECPYNFDLVRAMEEVGKSNMSKIPTLQEVMDVYGTCSVAALESASDWIETTYPRYKGVTGKVVQYSLGVAVVVFRDNNKKVMKWAGFQEPNLLPCIGKY